MPEDRRKLLEALAAKRKADNENNDRKKSKTSSPTVAKHSDSSGLKKGKVHSSSSSISRGPKPAAFKGHEKAKHKPQKKPAKWEDEDVVSSESEKDSSDDDRRNRLSKTSSKFLKLPLPSTSGSGTKGRAFNGMDKPAEKGDYSLGKGKKKKKATYSDDEEDDGGADVDDGDVSEDPLDEVDMSNILPDRTRRRNSQPVRYNFGNASDDDDDSDA